MILDDLSKLSSYAAWCPALEQVAQFMATHKLEQLPDGRVELPEIGGFVNIQTIGAKTHDQARLESHRRMIDVQVPLTGDEEMGLTPLAQAAPAPYDEERDLSFHEGAPHTLFTVRKGMFALFAPADVHAPGITPTGLRKAVFKIPVN